MSVRIIFILTIFFALTGFQRDYEPRIYKQPTSNSYLLGTGDELRVIVFEQAELSRTYKVDASGKISVPLAGLIRARNRTTNQVQRSIEARLRNNNFVKDPKVSVEVIAYRPFFILGEVKTAGKYPYENNITVESAVAIAGGYTDRASKKEMRLTRKNRKGEVVERMVPPTYLVRPGDTIIIKERWF